MGWVGNEEEGRDVELVRVVSFPTFLSLIFLSLADHLYYFFLSQITKLFPSLARQHICYPRSPPSTFNPPPSLQADLDSSFDEDSRSGSLDEGFSQLLVSSIISLSVS